MSQNSSSSESLNNLSPDRQIYYRLIKFIYQNRLLPKIEHTQTWRHFKQLNSDVDLTPMELKLCFCIEIMQNLYKFPWIDFEMLIYLAGRRILMNADELLMMVDLEYGVHYISLDDYEKPSLDQNLKCIPSHQVGQIPVQLSDDPVPKKECKILTDQKIVRPIFELMKIVMRTKTEDETGVELTQEEVHARIAQKITEECDFEGFWKTRQQELDQKFHEIEPSDAGLQGLAFDNIMDITDPQSQMTVNASPETEPRRAQSNQDLTITTRPGHGTLRRIRSAEPFPKFASRMQTRYQLRRK